MMGHCLPCCEMTRWIACQMDCTRQLGIIHLHGMHGRWLLRSLSAAEPKPGSLDGRAAVHHHSEAGCGRTLRRRFINDAQL